MPFGPGGTVSIVSGTIHEPDWKRSLRFRAFPAQPGSAVHLDAYAAWARAPGFGGTAFFLDIAGAGTQLHIVRGDRNYLLVSVLGFGEAARVSRAAERMARKALGRL